MTDAPLPPDERDLLAAELALGLLEGIDRAAALRLQLADPDFAAAVQAWQLRLSPLHAGVAEVPPPNQWAAIERRLQSSAEMGRPANVSHSPRWRWAAIGSALMAASLAAVVLLRPVPQPLAPVANQVVVADLTDPASSVRLLANYDPSSGILRVRPLVLPSSRLAPELWIIGSDQVPRSLGLMAASGTSRIAVAESHRALMQEGATLAVTMEPIVGAPHLKPSSTPVAVGKISTI